MKIAVLIPCYNEAQTVAQVIADFGRELPEAEIFVYDNNSSDDTAQIAMDCGATVRREHRQGKGNVMRSMFRDIEADLYVMADGDCTYPAEEVHKLIAPVLRHEADMVMGDRLSNGSYTSENKRPFHDFGNNLVKGLINFLFQSDLKDIMTGYRVFNRRFVKSIPILSKGFEIETEIVLQALDKGFLIKEVAIAYRDRPEGSESKLNTVRDGARVLKTVFTLFKDYRPLLFFSSIAGILFLLGLLIGTPVLVEFAETHLISKVPSAILAVGIMILSMGCLTCGIILDTVLKLYKETYILLSRQDHETFEKVEKLARY